jgi:hypothetical protein
MKVKKVLTEYGYLIVMGLCLACSAALLISVTIDKPIVAIAREHVPVLRTERAVREEEHSAEILLQEETVKQEDFPAQTMGFLLTEDALEEQLGAFLPENFPAEDLDVSFDGGLLSLSFDMSRARLKSYLKEQGAELGLKRDLLLQMLPRTVELEAVFSLNADQSGLHLTPVMLTAGEKVFSLSGLPQNVFSAVDTGLNALLNSAGVRFSSVEFTEDGLLLK